MPATLRRNVDCMVRLGDNYETPKIAHPICDRSKTRDCDESSPGAKRWGLLLILNRRIGEITHNTKRSRRCRTKRARKRGFQGNRFEGRPMFKGTKGRSAMQTQLR